MANYFFLTYKLTIQYINNLEPITIKKNERDYFNDQNKKAQQI